MPRPLGGSAIGYYENSIYILGGMPYQHQLLRYDILQNEFHDLGEYPLSIPIFGYGQFYTTHSNTMYMINLQSEHQFATFNLENAQFSIDWPHENIAHYVGSGGCIATCNDFIFILGGASNDRLQIFSFSDNKWIENTPSMIESRTHLSCNVVDNNLYAIGGYDPLQNRDLKSVELIDTNGQNSWKFMNAELLFPTESARSVVYKTYIFVIGGLSVNSDGMGGYIENVQVIDTMNDIITNGDKLVESMENTAAIIVNDVVYAFGGYHSEYMRSMQYSVLPKETINPTKAPTKAPTNISTQSPTMYPTKSPSMQPTNAPSKVPTEIPTHFPTISPTVNPSQSPLFLPTYSPTEHPTISPTRYPTKIPSLSPLISPTTNEPTWTPTASPILAQKQNSRSSAVIAFFLALGLFTFLVIGYLFLRRWYLNKMRPGHGFKAHYNESFDAEELLNVMHSSVKAKPGDRGYIPMKTIDEEKSLSASTTVYKYQIFDDAERGQMDNEKENIKEKKAKRKKRVLFRGAR